MFAGVGIWLPCRFQHVRDMITYSLCVLCSRIPTESALPLALIIGNNALQMMSSSAGGITIEKCGFSGVPSWGDSALDFVFDWGVHTRGKALSLAVSERVLCGVDAKGARRDAGRLHVYSEAEV